MKLDEIVAWYQKKIGTYDKEQWEKTVEQKILDGFTSFTLKNAKLKTEFIDVDLVRGSTFPKAKPKQTLLTVIRLAVLRYFFLPIYAQWWVKQTSPNIFGILLFLYITQMISWAVYTFNIHRLDNIENATVNPERIVSISELLIPMALSLLLSLIHSQIVATNSVSGISSKRKHYSNAGGKPRERTRRRKKMVKMRSHDSADVPATIKPTVGSGRVGISSAIITSLQPEKSDLGSNINLNSSSLNIHMNNSELLVEASKSSAIDLLSSSSSCGGGSGSGGSTSSSKFILDQKTCDMTRGQIACTEQLANNKKRNVNWDSPIHNFAVEVKAGDQHTSSTTQNSVSTTTTSSNSYSLKALDRGSGTTNTNRIDNGVQEFYDDLMNKTDDDAAANSIAGAPNLKRNIGEDDGFESLNGKSSSGEENLSAALRKFESSLPVAALAKKQLRLRLNAATTDLQLKLDGDNVNLDLDPSIKLSGFRNKCPLSSESDFEKTIHRSSNGIFHQIKSTATAPAINKIHQRSKESSDTDEEGEDGDILSNPASLGACNYTECTTSATEWLGITTNSEEYSSELENSDYYKQQAISDDDFDYTPTTILNPHGSTDRISCTIWDQGDIKKTQMSVLEISSCIIERVEAMPETSDYIYIAIIFSIILSLIPSFCRLCEVTIDSEKPVEINYFDVPMLLWEKASCSFLAILRFAFGETQWERTVLIIGFIQRLCLTLILFIILAVAERIFKQRFLYAKLFSHLTSSRRARKSDVPHFRLNKVRNIKTWLSVRSYLKKRGPQRSVDVIMSAAFIVTMFLLSFLSVEWLKDSVHLHSHLNLEALLWSAAIVIFLLRFMTLGNKINRKYRSISVLITEQINLYLQIEQKPKKKDELMVSNSVLKLAGDLLKELESPFKISGLSANPYLFTTVKVVILSALSGVLSEMLGFKLKLHKIKIK